MEKSPDARIVFVTVPNYESALHISKILVTEKLAACCSINQNVVSVFGWQGNIQDRHENLLIIKTLAGKMEQLEARVREMHSDEVPEIAAFPLDSASAPYLKWLNQALAD